MLNRNHSVGRPDMGRSADAAGPRRPRSWSVVAAAERIDAFPEFDDVLDRLEVWHRDVPGRRGDDASDDARATDR